MELVLAQGAGGSVLPGKRLELGDEGGDGGFHGAEKERSVKTVEARGAGRQQKASPGGLCVEQVPREREVPEC